MSTVISIQARLGSTRLPGKVLLPIGSRRILERVVQQAETAATDGVDVIVALGDEPENEALEELCRRDGFDYVVGPEDDLLDRHLRVARSGDYDTLIRLTADCPFVPPEEIKRTHSVHSSNDAEYTRNDWPPGAERRMPIGTAVDVFDVPLLERLAESGATHPNRRLLDSADEYAVEFSPNRDWGGFSDIHLAIDTPDDYWRLVDAVDAVSRSSMSIAEWLTE